MPFYLLKPTSDVSSVSWQDEGGSAVNLFDNVNDIPTDDVNWIKAVPGAAPNSVTFEIQEPAIGPDERLQRVRTQGRIRADIGTGTDVLFQQVLAADGTVLYSDSVATSSTSFNTFFGSYQDATAQGKAWDLATINTARLKLFGSNTGLGAANTWPRCSQTYVELITNLPPDPGTVTVSGQGESTRPTVHWDYTDPDDDPQVRYHVRVFDAAAAPAGFDPDVVPAVWDSGEVASPAASAVVAADLVPGRDYTVVVRVAQDWVGEPWWSGWSAPTTFTMESATTPAIPTLAPPPPTITVTTDQANLRQEIVVDAAPNLLSDDQATFRSSVADWGSVNCTIAQIAFGLFGPHGLQLTATGGAPATVFSAVGGAEPDTALPVVPGETYTAVAHANAVTTVRPFRAVIRWRDATGLLLSTTPGTFEDDGSGTGFVKNEVSGVAPAGARFAGCQVEVGDGVSDPAAAEQHRIDGCSLHKGTSLEFTNGGTWQSGRVLVEAADLLDDPMLGGADLANWAAAQLASGSDDHGAPAGFTVRTADGVASDPAEQHAGHRSVRWDTKVGTGGMLDMGAPNLSPLTDSTVPLRLPAVPGVAMRGRLWAKASAVFSSKLIAQSLDHENVAVGSPSDGGAISITTAWQPFEVLHTPGTGVVAARLSLENSAAVTGVSVWVDEVSWAPSAQQVDDLAPGLGVPVVWRPVRAATPPVSSTSKLKYVAFDEECPPGRARAYRARCENTGAAGILVSGPSDSVPARLDPPAVFHLKHPYRTEWSMALDAVEAVPLEVEEDVLVAQPLGAPLPGAVATVLGGRDSTGLKVTLAGPVELHRFERLLTSQVALLLCRPEGGSLWVRWTGRRLEPVTFLGPAYQVTVAFREVSRPPDVTVLAETT